MLAGVPLSTLPSCKSKKPELNASEKKKKKKKKVKKCKLPECHVRMNHYHEGAEFRGKRGGIFTAWFAPKQPRYGQANPKFKKRTR
ncbi:MAG: hypothetical protein EAZ57_04590 [Cytophagales bacterium]|nr:MAG: hypothetical protein EAZ67_05610 [Cytophagales bacterium]TAF61274.1 MAG: hypothetical protein EAZ57_04590 [Cytophagales bacterium]